MKNIIQPIKSLYRQIIGKEWRCKTINEPNTKLFGSTYGGWWVVSDKINNNSIIYSFGIGKDISFDLAIIQAFEVHVYAFDPTPESIDWVKTQNIPQNFHAYPYGLAEKNGSQAIYAPDNPNHISHTLIKKEGAKKISVEFRTLDNLMQMLGHTSIDVLKMDIEGAEYEVIKDLIKKRLFPYQLLIEFHHNIYPGIQLQHTKDAVFSLLNVGYQVFKISDTNREFHFIRK